MKLPGVFLSIALISIVFSCGNTEKEINAYKDFSGARMLKDKWYELKLSDSIPTGQEMFPCFLTIRFNEDYPFESIIIDIEKPGVEADSIIYQRLNIPLFSKEGASLADKKFGIYEINYPIEEKIIAVPGLPVSVRTPMDSIEGLISVGMIISGNNQE